MSLALSVLFGGVGGGGTGTGVGLTLDHIFESTTARDNYFTTRTDELIIGTPIVVNIGTAGSPDVRFQVWAGANQPNAYPSPITTEWVDAGNTSLTLEQITLITSLLNVDQTYIPVKTSANMFGNSSMRELPDRIISTKSIQTPGGTVFVSQNLGLGGAGLAFAIQDVANGRRGYLIGYERLADGSGRPFFRDLSAVQLRSVLQAAQDANSSGTAFNIQITASANRLITKVYLESPDTGTADIRILYGDNTGEEVAMMENISFTADTEVEINIPEGLFIENNQQYTVAVDGVRLKGTGIGADFQIFLAIDWHEWSTSYLSGSNDQIELTNFSINLPSRVDVGTDLSGSRTVNYHAVHSANISSVWLQLNGSNLVQLTNPTSDGDQSQSVTLPAIATGSETTLRFRLIANDTITSNTQLVRVANPVPHELLYWGVEADNSPSGFDYANAQSKDGLSGNITVPDFANTGYIKIAYPASAPALTEIVIDNVNQIGAFTLALGALTINSISYNVMVSNNPLLGSIVSGEVITLIR